MTARFFFFGFFLCILIGFGLFQADRKAAFLWLTYMLAGTGGILGMLILLL